MIGISAFQDWCLMFSVYMYGYNMGTLVVKAGSSGQGFNADYELYLLILILSTTVKNGGRSNYLAPKYTFEFLQNCESVVLII